MESARLTQPYAFLSPCLPKQQYRRCGRPALVCSQTGSSDRAPSSVGIAAAALVAAASVLGADAVLHPPQADALTFAPAPINAYAQRRQEIAYQAYMQQLEKRFEALSGADIRKVVEAGGGGLGVSYRVAGFAAFVASACSTAVVHPLDTLKTRMQARSQTTRKQKRSKPLPSRQPQLFPEELGPVPTDFLDGFASREILEQMQHDWHTGQVTPQEQGGRATGENSAEPEHHRVSAVTTLEPPPTDNIDEPDGHSASSVLTSVESTETDSDASDESCEEEDIKLFSGLYKGIESNIMKEAPNSAIYLGVYELIKNYLLSTSTFHNLPLLVFVISGALGDALGSIVRVPAEIVNKRLQLGVNDDVMSALRDSFLSTEGRRASFVAWQAVLWRDVPYGGMQIGLYEFIKQYVALHPGFAGLHDSGLFSDIITGAVAGMVAAVLTTPMDVLVTRLSVQNPQSYLETRRYMGVASTARRLVEEEGVGALFSGFWQRGLYYAPLIGLFFALYETTRGFINDPHAIVVALTSLQDRIGQYLHDAVFVTSHTIGHVLPASFVTAIGILSSNSG